MDVTGSWPPADSGLLRDGTLVLYMVGHREESRGHRARRPCLCPRSLQGNLQQPPQLTFTSTAWASPLAPRLLPGFLPTQDPHRMSTGHLKFNPSKT